MEATCRVARTECAQVPGMTGAALVEALNSPDPKVCYLALDLVRREVNRWLAVPPAARPAQGDLPNLPFEAHSRFGLAVLCQEIRRLQAQEERA